MEELIEHLGAIAVFIATAVEGEVSYLSALVLVQLGKLKLWEVVAAAFFGGVVRDLSIFFSARSGGGYLLKSKPQWRAKMDVVGQKLSSKRSLFFLAIHRYVYGLSTATIITLAVTGMKPIRFMLVTLVACTTWTAGYGYLGYKAAGHIMEHLEWYQSRLLIILISIGVVVAIINFMVKRRKRKSATPPSPDN